MKKIAVKENKKAEQTINSGQSDEKKMNRRIVLFLITLCFLIYGKSLKNNYSMDDEFVIRNNVQVQKGIKAIPEIFKTTYVIDSQKSNYEYRPLVKTSFAIEYQIFGANPHISHLFNVLLYTLSIVLLYFLLVRLLPNYNKILPFIITLIFLVHPLHSEVVISIKNRDVILSFIGCLLALFFYLKYADTKKYYHLFFGAFFILFALMSKKDSMTYFAVIPFTLWFFKGIPFKKLGIVFASFLFPILVFKLMARSVHQDIIRKFLEWENPLYIHSTIIQRIPTGLYSIYFYLKMFLIPHPLISYYGYNQVPIAKWSNPIVWIVLLVLIAVGYYIIKNIKLKKLEVYGVLYFFITISMFTNVLVPVVGIVGERFAFIPSLGLSILAAIGLFKLFKIAFDKKGIKFPSLSNSFLITIGIIVLLFGGRSFARIKDWKDTYTLYKTDADKATESAHENALFAAASVQKVKENQRMKIEEKRAHIADAVKYYQNALRIIPDYTSTLNNLGMIYYTYYNKPEESIPYLKKAISLDTNYVEAYFNLATCEAKLGHLEEAEKHYLKTIAIDPKFYDTYSSLSNLYADQKQYDKIISLNQNAINKGIESAMLDINIGNVYYLQGDTLKALPYLERGIELNHNNKGLNSFLANYYKEKGDLEKANYYYDLMASSK